jgi:hypothetical protein
MVGLPKLRVLLVFVLLIAVLVICIAPFVDLEPTALRACRLARALLLAIAALSQMIQNVLPAEVPFETQPERKERSSQVRQEANLFQLNCALRC